MMDSEYIRRVVLPFSWALAIACGPGVAEGPMPMAIDTVSLDTMDSESESPAPQSVRGTDTDSDLSEEDTDSDPNEEDTDSDLNAEDTDEATPLWCPQRLVYDDISSSAEDLLENSHFVSASRDCLLLRRDEDDEIRTAVVFTTPYWEEHVVARAENLFSAAPVSITCQQDPRSGIQTAVVLMSDDSGSRLVEVTDQSEAFTPFTGSEALNDYQLTGLARLIRTTGNGFEQLCVYGEGLMCMDESADAPNWTEEIAPESEVQIHGVALVSSGDDWILLAVGTGGLLMAKTEAGWENVDSGTTETLFTVASHGDRFYAAGQSGTLIHGTLEEIFQSTIIDGNIVSIIWRFNDAFRGITREGHIFEGHANEEEITLCPVETVEGPLQESLFMSCGDEENFVILTRDVLIGGYECSQTVII